MYNPCFECYIRYNRQYTEECDENCEYANALSKLKSFGGINMENYGMGKADNPKSVELYNFISKLDFENGDYFCFKSGGDGDNGEFLMDLLDCYFANVEYSLQEILDLFGIVLRCNDGCIHCKHYKMDKFQCCDCDYQNSCRNYDKYELDLDKVKEDYCEV